MEKSSEGALNDVLMTVQRRIISKVLHCTPAALIPSTLHWDAMQFRWKRKWWVCLCLYSSEHALNPQSYCVCRRGKYIWGSMQEDGFSCHCSHQPRPCLLQHSWASGVSLEQLQTGEPPAKVRMELLIKVPLTQPSIFRLDELLWPKPCPSTAFPLVWTGSHEFHECECLTQKKPKIIIIYFYYSLLKMAAVSQL